MTARIIDALLHLLKGEGAKFTFGGNRFTKSSGRIPKEDQIDRRRARCSFGSSNSTAYGLEMITESPLQDLNISNNHRTAQVVICLP
jgi:hypothetical protein